MGAMLLVAAVANGCSSTAVSADAVGTGGAAQLGTGGSAGAGGAAGTGGMATDAGSLSSFPCVGHLGYGGFSGNFPDGSVLDDVCMTGQSYCAVFEVANHGGDYVGMCRPLPASCISSPTCACFSTSINCTCSHNGDQLTQSCSVI
jgi:hypothetical protein